MPKYVAGDRVRIVDSFNFLGARDEARAIRVGMEGVVTEYDGFDNTYLVELSGQPTWYWPEKDLVAGLPVPVPEFGQGTEVITEAFGESKSPFYLPAKMERYTGMAGRINEIKTADGQPVYLVHGWYWPASALEKVESPPETTMQAQSARVIETGPGGLETVYRFDGPCKVIITAAG